MNWRLKLIREIDRAALEAKERLVKMKEPPLAISGEVWLDVHFDDNWTEHQSHMFSAQN